MEKQTKIKPIRYSFFNRPEFQDLKEKKTSREKFFESGENFCRKNTGYIFKKIALPDVLLRQKGRNHMSYLFSKKITISYTGKGLVSSPTELCVPGVAIKFMAGQTPTVKRAEKSVSNWKLRKNSLIGCKTTIRETSALLFLEQNNPWPFKGLWESPFSPIFCKKKRLADKKANIFKDPSKKPVESFRLYQSSFCGFSLSV